MLPDRVSNPGPLTYESGALPMALRGPAFGSANIAIRQQTGFFFVFPSKKPPRSSYHINLKCIFMVAKEPKAELRFPF